MALIEARKPPQEWCDRLRFARLQAGLSQGKLGEQLGYTTREHGRRAVKAWEEGVATPGICQIRALANALGVTIESLIP